jgi:hypothetical protein
MQAKLNWSGLEHDSDLFLSATTPRIDPFLCIYSSNSNSTQKPTIFFYHIYLLNIKHTLRIYGFRRRGQALRDLNSCRLNFSTARADIDNGFQLTFWWNRAVLL